MSVQYKDTSYHPQLRMQTTPTEHWRYVMVNHSLPHLILQCLQICKNLPG